MGVATLLNAVSANTTGPVAALGSVYGNLTLEVTTTGTVSAFSVQLLGSLDGQNYEAIGSAVTSTTAGESVGSGTLFQYFYATLSGYSGTGTVTCALAYSLEASSSGGGGPGAVTSVFTRTGAVVAASGDYTVSQVTGAAPLASPALSGTPTAPTATALTDSTQLATTAYADSAVAVETSRAETAEALKAPLASPALTGTPTGPTGSALTDSTQLATTAYADSAVAVETSRAETAEALKLPLAGGTMSGAIAMGSNKVTGLTNGTASSDAAAYGQIPVPSQSNGLLAWNCDLNAVGTGGTIAVGGTVYLLGLWLPNPITISNIWWYNTTAGVSPTASECQVGIYNSSGSLAASSTTAAAGTGVTAASGSAAEVALSSSYASPAGLCWVGMVFQAGTLPTILHCSTSGASIANVGRTAATYRVATNGTLVTTGLPGTITPSSNSAAGTINFWVGVS